MRCKLIITYEVLKSTLQGGRKMDKSMKHYLLYSIWNVRN